MMRNHPTEGALSLAQMRGITNLPGRMASASFEHHRNLDYSGYPKLNVPWKLSMTGRILMIADSYDAMTSSRVYRREPMSPAKVLNILFAKSGASFDPTLMKLFMTCVGIIPIGSLVMLDTNELAVVLKPETNQAEAEYPYVKVITDPSGTPVDNGRELDQVDGILSAVDPYCFRFFVSGVQSGLAAAWLRDLSDGYVAFDDDPLRKLPGPVVVSKVSAEAPVPSAESTTSRDKPYFVGQPANRGSQPLPPFEWQEQ